MTGPLPYRVSFLAAIVWATSSAAGAEPVRGDPAEGRALFVGERAFAGGGAPCGACHAVGGQDIALAASFGPELSQSFAGMPEEAVDGLLQDLPFPTMAPIYAGRGLTPAERAHLASFLLASTGKAAPGGGTIAGCAALVAVACLAAMAIASRKRKGSTREQLLARAFRVQGGSR